MDRQALGSAFGIRLQKALAAHPSVPAGYGRNSWLRKELASAGINVSAETIRKWVSGESIPRPDKMGRIAKALRVDTSWLAIGPQGSPSTQNDAFRIQQLEEALRKIEKLSNDREILRIVSDNI